MYEHYQLEIPDSFMALFIEPGRQRPRATRDAIAARYEICEDLANHLCEQTRSLQHEWGVGETDVLQRVLRGLQSDASGIDANEALWVVRRLAELSGWSVDFAG